MYGFSLSPMIALFQHRIKAYENIYAECKALRVKNKDRNLPTEERVVARAQAQILVQSTLTSLVNRYTMSGLTGSQKEQLKKLISDFENLKV
ncbi:hypothetical protein phiAS5_ORF0244 [Aeromonas phage phiAS5]|uniref:Uncharacterized protein n=1 Tax=Aeromonas phage phiAS5 TaxID=879630 RepID=E1A1Z8_9CAUD|nr:hypothetical protein phiAS5_ORF0244 [Aeromonas phage phiAS5]ADM80087.1 hypothetical protein phiAS5_ORF0244 [Aeromonas phage phiAS5]BES53149.1 hypothetical protein [Aeromonas phage phiWae14]